MNAPRRSTRGGFTLIETERYRGEGADGVVRDWYALTVRKEDR